MSRLGISASLLLMLACLAPHVASAQPEVGPDPDRVREALAVEDAIDPDEAAPEEAAPDEAASDEPASDEPAHDEAASDEAAPDASTSDEAASDESTSHEAASDEATSDEATFDEAASDGTTSDEAVAPRPLDPCGGARSRPVGPLQLGGFDGNLGVAHRACPRLEAAIGGDALLMIHTEDFYGQVVVNGRVRLSAPLFDPRVEAFLSWEAFRYHTVVSSLDATYTGLGYLSWGVAGQVYVEGDTAISVTGRFVAPTTTGLDQGSQPLALDLGVTAAWQAASTLRFHGWLMVLGSLGVGGPTLPQGGLRVGAGLDWHPADWIGIVLEVLSGFGYVEPLDVVAAQLGFRFTLGNEFGLELAASMPFAGTRALDDGALQAAATLMLSWRPH